MKKIIMTLLFCVVIGIPVQGQAKTTTVKNLNQRQSEETQMLVRTIKTKNTNEVFSVFFENSNQAKTARREICDFVQDVRTPFFVRQKGAEVSVSNGKWLCQEIKLTEKTNTKIYKICKRIGIKNGQKPKTAYAKIKNYICKKLKYKRTQADVGTALKTGRGNCVAYARLNEKMCGTCGIPCKSYSGFTGTIGHEWNRVKIGGKWYWSDLCWMDTGGGNQFFLMKSLKTHSKYTRNLYIHQKNGKRVAAS